MSKYDLLSISTKAPSYLDKKEIKEKTEKLVAELGELQDVLFAEAKHSLLIVLQGMDASGKDGAVRNVFSAINPQGVRVQSFKVPSTEELSHDFLWRIHKHAPERGMIQIFNRSHYEDVLVTRVSGLITETTAKRRYNYINAFENMLQDCGTKVTKFYLHISEEEQQQRFQERLTDPEKYWKFSPSDITSATHWGDYRGYYQEIFENCSPEIPWLIVPSDNKWYKEYFIAKTIVDTLKNFKMKYPKLNTK